MVRDRRITAGQRRPVRIAGITITAALAAGLAACSSGSSAGSSTGAGAPGALAAVGGASATPNAAFYKGKTITWDVPSAPGASFYTSATVLAPLVGKYLGATVNVVSVPAGATIAGQDQAAAAPSDGLTIGTLNVSANVTNAATKQPGINFDMTKVGFIAGLPINPDVFVTSPSSKYQSFASLIQGQPSITATDYPGSIDVLEKAVFGAYGIKAKLISGYADVPSQVAGFLRGDAQFAINQVPGYAPPIEAGKAVPLLVTGPVAPGSAGYAKLKDVPTIASFAAAHPPATAAQKQSVTAMEALFGSDAVNQVFFTPAGTPAGLTAALGLAFKSAEQNPATATAFTKANLAVGYLSGAQAAAAINTDVEQESALAHAIASFQS
jgi:tripartite-type tricarboxylate transporter receptor subunit TctC